MRYLFFLLLYLFQVIALKAQTVLPGSFQNSVHENIFDHKNLYDSSAQKKWFLTKYTGITTSYIFLKGSNAAVIAAPIGLQLNRRLNNNLYAFAAVSVAPAYVNFNRSFLSSNANKGFQNNSFLKSNSFDMYSRAEMGLMYINDNKTFSISGSISIERSSYPMFPVNQINNTKQNSFPAPN